MNAPASLLQRKQRLHGAVILLAHPPSPAPSRWTSSHCPPGRECSPCVRPFKAEVSPKVAQII